MPSRAAATAEAAEWCRLELLGEAEGPLPLPGRKSEGLKSWGESRECGRRRGAQVTSGVQGFEGDVQGYSREAEGEAQPVQEADLIAQQMACQQQSADFLRAEKQEGAVMGGVSGPLCKEGQALSTTAGESRTRPNSRARAAGLQGREEASRGGCNAVLLCVTEDTKEMPSQNRQHKRRQTKRSCAHRNKGEPSGR